MNSSALEAGAAAEAPPGSAWTWQRRWVLIAIVFVVHLGLIFILGDRKSVKPVPTPPSLAITVVLDPNKLPPMDNPVLFALPHHQGFAGAALAKISTISIPPFRWSEPARFLSLPVDSLCAGFERLTQDNVIAPFQFEVKPPAMLDAVPFVSGITTGIRTQSTVRIVDELSKRRLLNPRPLPSQPPAPDLLTNTIVRVTVGADGLVISTAPLQPPPGSGSEKADREALEYARTSRFAPLSAGTTGPSDVLMIFEWHVAPTNAPPNR